MFCIPASGQNSRIDSLEKTLQSQGDLLEINTLQELSEAYGSLNTRKALDYAHQALRLAVAAADTKKHIESLYNLGSIYAMNHNDSIATNYLHKGLHLAGKANDVPLSVEGYFQLARYCENANELRRSNEYLHKCLAISTKNNLDRQTAGCYHLLGSNYDKLSLYETSLGYYFKALAINESLRDEKEIARNFNSIGKVYQHTGDFDDAVAFFTKALNINRVNLDTKGEMINILNIGVIYQKKGHFDQALAYFKKALPMAKASGYKNEEAILTGNIGSTLVQKGQLTSGLEYLYAALAIKKSIQRKRSILHTLNDIAKVKLLLDAPGEAKQYAEEVIHLARAYEDGYQLRYAYLLLAKCYEKLGDYENAYAFLQKQEVVKDSLFGIEKAQQIKELQIEYETEKKDQAIAMLKQEKEIEGFRNKLYFLLGLVILTAVAILYNSQRVKAKRNKVLLEKEKEVDRLKSNFFANISHEFRTPLTLILGPIENLLSGNTDRGQQQMLGFMKKNAARLLRLINQILELSKIEADHSELRVKKGDIIPVLQGIAGSFSSLAESNGITLTFESDVSEQALFYNQSQIETIFINLLSNAFKFSTEGGKILVKASKMTLSGASQASFELKVIDRGKGMTTEQISHIFDRFYQAGHSDEDFFGGTGIGLTLTKELVELHGGTIAVESVLNSGTVVTVRLPIGKAHLREAQIVEDKTVIEDIFTADGALSDGKTSATKEHDEVHDDKKPIVLVIDDDEDVRQYIRSIISEAYNTIEAENGAEGITMAKMHIPDLIISDIMMPKMNGYDVCENIKQDEKTSHIPVILLTAKASINSRIEGLETQADLYMNKPFVPKELQLCINNLIQSRKKLRERYNKQVVLKPKDIAINSVDELFLDRLMKIFEANLGNETFTVDALTKEIGMSRSQLHRKLHALTNESTTQFIRSFRLQRAMTLLKKHHASISEIAFMVGFGSPSYFTKCFIKHYGCTPTAVLEDNVSVS